MAAFDHSPREESPFLVPGPVSPNGSYIEVIYDATSKTVAFEPHSHDPFDGLDVSLAGSAGDGVADGDDLELRIGELTEQARSAQWTVVSPRETSSTWTRRSPLDSTD